MKPNYIFGLTQRLIDQSDPIRAGWIVDSGGQDYQISMGTPCIIIKHSDKPFIPMHNVREPKKIVLLPFSTQHHVPNRLTLDTHHNIQNLAVKVGKETDFFDKIQQFSIDNVDVSKIYNTSKSVKEAGPITFLINNKAEKNVTEDIAKLFKKFHSKFKLGFQGKQIHNGCRSLVPGDEFLLAITVIDIGRCIPIFDSNKVDGIMIHVTGFYTEQTRRKDLLVPSCELNFYFSNHTTNLIDVDGQTMPRVITNFKETEKIIYGCDEFFRGIGSKKERKVSKKTSDKELKSESLRFRADQKVFTSGPQSYRTTGSSTSASYYHSGTSY